MQNNFVPGTTLCISGLISAGKSTFLRKMEALCRLKGVSCHVMPELLSETLCARLPTEPILFDTFMIAHRIQMSIDAHHIARSYDLVMMERCHLDHLAFLYAIDQVGWAPPEHTNWVRGVVRELNPPAPSRIIYLDVEPETAFQRMQLRAEPRDVNFTLSFFEALRDGYLRMLDAHTASAQILNWDDFGEGLNMEHCLRSAL